jgi:hypothetical protein
MKRSYIIFGILIAILIASYFISSNKTSFNRKAEISVKDTSAIEKILLVDMQNNKIILAKNKDNSWQLNNTYIARKDAISTIFTILYNLKAAQQVPHGKHNIVINELSAKGVKVEAYTKNNEVLTSFIIGGSNNDGKGNFILKKNMDQPFIYERKGFIGDLSTSFFTSESEWRNRLILNYPMDSIANVHVQYADFPDSSFSILNAKNELLLNNAKGIEAANYSHTKVKEFLGNFTDKYCMNFENHVLAADSIKYKGYAYGFVSVSSKAGKLDTLHFVRMKANQRATKVQQWKGVVFDQEYFYVYKQKDLMVVPSQSFSKILSIPSFFR